MLADDQVPVVVERHPVALVARVAQHGHAFVGMPAPPLVARHVAEVQRAVGHPDRPFGEREPGRDLLDLRVLVDESEHFLGLHTNRHRALLIEFRRVSWPSSLTLRERTKPLAPELQGYRSTWMRPAEVRSGPPGRPALTARISARIESAVSGGEMAPMSRPQGPWIRSSASFRHAGSEQPLAPSRLRGSAAERADVERVRLERGLQGREVELLVVRQDDDRRVAIGPNLRERLLGPLDDDLVGARHPLGGREAAARIDADRAPADRSARRRTAPRSVSTAPITTRRGGGPNTSAKTFAPSCSIRPLRRMSGASAARPPGSSPWAS